MIQNLKSSFKFRGIVSLKMWLVTIWLRKLAGDIKKADDDKEPNEGPSQLYNVEENDKTQSEATDSEDEDVEANQTQ